MKELNELVELANRANIAGQGTPEMVDFRVTASPDNILAIAEAFRALEKENILLKQGCENNPLVHEMLDWKERAEAAEAIIADVEEIIGLLAEREWAEHCTKTDTGKRLEEAITELHDEAAPAVSLAELVPDVEENEVAFLAGLNALVDCLDDCGDADQGLRLALRACRAAILRNIEEQSQ